MFKVLELRHFRGFDEARLTRLTRFNLITGLNGAGKTSLLEAAFLICGAANAGLVSSLYGIRGERIYAKGADRAFRSLFKDLDATSTPEIVASSSETLKGNKRYTRRLQIIPDFALSETGTSTAETRTLRGVTFDFVGPSGRVKNNWGWTPEPDLPPPGEVSTEPRVILGGSNGKNPDLVLAQFVSPYVRDVHPSDHSQLTALITERRQERVIQALQLISPKLVALHPLTERNDKVIYADVGGKALLPISLLGSGLVNCLHMVLPSVRITDGVLLIDEFEDGIHHSLHLPLLKIILDLAREQRNQVFFSTHSSELLHTFVSLARQDEELAADVSFFRLGRLGLKGLIPRYSLAEAHELLQQNLDIR